MEFDVASRTVLLVRHGSHAYGLNTPTSDEDFKGVCIKPRDFYLGFLRRFEQQEHIGSKSDGIDKVVYSLDKFAALAADCNPNIIEVLHVADEDVLQCDAFGEELRAHRDDFLSRKAKHTFAGYAHAQLKRIETHRGWLLEKPSMPERSDFGLSEVTKVTKSELGAFDSLLGLKTVDDEALTAERAVEVEQVARESLGVELPKDVVTLFTREKAYRAAVAHYEQYLGWLKSRNPARAELEAKFGYDTKHGLHLLRLMRMCREILSTGKVVVKRTHDREELLAVRRGERSYDNLIEEAQRLEAECEALYATSALPREPDRKALDAMIVSMTEGYLRLYG
jgi:hypothetical protein